MDVDKAGRDQLAAGIDLFAAFVQDAADFHDAAIRYRDIRFEQVAAKAVGNAAAADHEVWVIGHGVSSRVNLLPHHGLSRDAVNCLG
jgi:hypothetical protein